VSETTKTRRLLTFDTLDDAATEARRLLEGGYERAGAWGLAGNCEHLTRFMRFSLDGFPSRGMPGPIAWVLRKLLLSDKKLAKPMPVGLPTPRFLRPVETEAEAELQDRADAEAVARFVEQLDRVKERTEAGDPWARSPLFGHVSPKKWPVIHRKHAEHHLGFLVPRDQS
jgi:hypothetical protein